MELEERSGQLLGVASPRRVLPPCTEAVSAACRYLDRIRDDEGPCPECRATCPKCDTCKSALGVNTPCRSKFIYAPRSSASPM